MNRLSPAKRAQIITALIEGNSIASTCRMLAVAKMTVLSLLREVGQACLRFHDAQVRGLSTTDVQCDEIWSYCYSKQKNIPAHLQGQPGYGSVWTWTALDSDSKMMISWVVSDRSQEAADAIIADLKSRITNRIQLNSDGLPAYLQAVVKTFRAGEVDHAEIVKKYASSKPSSDVSPNSAASRYSPGRLLSIEKRVALGDPERGPRLDVVHGAVQPHHPHAESPLHASHECLLQKAGESRAHARHHDGLLQLLPEAHVPRRQDSGHGRGHHQLPLDRE